MITHELRLPVRHHDDGTRAGMYDLQVFRDSIAIAAVEVTASLDRDAVQLWKLVNPPGHVWTEQHLQGRWSVALSPRARAKRLRSELPGLLKQLEAANVSDLRTNTWGLTHPLVEVARGLGVHHAFHGGDSVPGRIYLTIDQDASQTGGMVADNGDALSGWLATFLRENERADLLAKLSRANTPERHAFVILGGFSTAPFGAMDVLLRDHAPLPEQAPELPAPVTHVWAVSTWASGVGMRWSPEMGWSRFDKLVRDDQ
jgi:hypothetical protein